MGDFVEERKTFNAQLSQRIHTVENSLNQKLDGLQSEMDHKFDNVQNENDQQFDNLQNSISRLTNQHVHQEEESPEEECLIDTTVEEQCKQQNEAISPLLTKEGGGKEAGKRPKSLSFNQSP